MEQEIWKDIKGYEGYFKISNLGRVMAIERYVKQGNGLRYCKERIVPYHLNPFGYPCVTLCKEKKSKQHPVHRLIMEAFVPNPENKPHNYCSIMRKKVRTYDYCSRFKETKAQTSGFL